MDNKKNYSVKGRKIKPKFVSFEKVKEEDLTYTPDDQIIESFINELREGKEDDKNKALANAVFLDILEGNDFVVVAKKYRITKEEVERIYEERLGFIKSILMFDDKVVLEEVEKREEYTSNVKILTKNEK